MFHHYRYCSHFEMWIVEITGFPFVCITAPKIYTLPISSFLFDFSAGFNPCTLAVHFWLPDSSVTVHFGWRFCNFVLAKCIMATLPLCLFIACVSVSVSVCLAFCLIVSTRELPKVQPMHRSTRCYRRISWVVERLETLKCIRKCKNVMCCTRFGRILHRRLHALQHTKDSVPEVRCKTASLLEGQGSEYLMTAVLICYFTCRITYFHDYKSTYHANLYSIHF